jgi:hypothetical protein
MPEVIHDETQSETVTEQRSAEVVKTKDGWDVGYGLTKDDVPPEITLEASRPVCPEHLDGGWKTGAGYAGGGFGPYKICLECGAIFGKTAWKDGNQ